MQTPALPLPESELNYVVLLFALFIIPRALQRLRIPTAITSLALGTLAGMGLGVFVKDPTVELLSTLGIVSLFLFAGLDVEHEDLRREAPFLLQHLVLRLLLLGLAVAAITRLVGLPSRPAALVGLALLTPSTGFILDSLHSWGFSEKQEFWVRTKAIATELLALGALFVVLQSTTALRLTLSALALGALIAILPVIMRAFADFIVPFAPKSEFAFLILTAVMCALATYKLGVYYLVGAFLVGVAAQRMRERLPAIASEKMVNAVEAFATLFVPFYFFGVGTQLRRGDFTLEALLIGLAFLATAVPVRVGVGVLHRWAVLREPPREGIKLSMAVLPTLVFTLVLAQILRERFDVPAYVFGGLVVYAVLNTLLPSIILHMPPPDFEAPAALHLVRHEPTKVAALQPAPLSLESVQPEVQPD